MEKNVLAGGGRSGISCALSRRSLGTGGNRLTNTTTLATTDRWFHYDQVGSVIAATDSSGSASSTPGYLRHADAFGNTQTAWDTGLWADNSSLSPWQHNTKEWDRDMGYTYMLQRWYGTSEGIFVSRAPKRPFVEHPYVFVGSRVTLHTDVRGEFVDEKCVQKCIKTMSAWEPTNGAIGYICRASCSTQPMSTNFFEPNCKTGCDDAVKDVEHRLGKFGWSCSCEENNGFPGLDPDDFGTHFYMTCTGPNGEVVTHNVTIGLWPGDWIPW